MVQYASMSKEDSNHLPNPSIEEEYARALRIAAGEDDEIVTPPRAIWKFGAPRWPIGSYPGAEPQMWIMAVVPEGSRFLACASVRGVPTVWLEVPQSYDALSGVRSTAETRYFRLIKAGEQIAPDAIYRGIIVIDDGDLVLFVYETATAN